MRRLQCICVLLLVVVCVVDAGGRDFYKMLGVPRDASEKQIQKAWRKTAARLHPDRSDLPKEKAEAKFQEAAFAYEVLSDPKKKEVYDVYGEDGLKPGSGVNHDGNGNTFQFRSGAPGGGFGGFNFQDIFSQFMGGSFNDPGAGHQQQQQQRGGQRPPQQRQQQHQQQQQQQQPKAPAPPPPPPPPPTPLALSIEEMFAGDESREVTLPPEKKGEAPRKGTVKILAGARNGTTVFVNGVKGAKMILKEIPHNTFWRTGDDLHCNITVTLTEALTGTSIKVPLLDKSTLPMTIDHVIKPGSFKRIEGQGMLVPGTTKRGRLVVHFHISFPTSVSSEQKDIIKGLDFRYQHGGY